MHNPSNEGFPTGSRIRPRSSSAPYSTLASPACKAKGRVSPLPPKARLTAGAPYSQLSQRHLDASDTTFVVHSAIQKLAKSNPAVFDRWKSHMVASRELYADLAGALGERHPDLPDQTRHRQAAWSVLPNAAETKVFVGANTRALRHMIATRAYPAADPETRRLFVKVFEIMRRVSPVLMHGMKVVALEDGTRGVESACPEL